MIDNMTPIKINNNIENNQSLTTSQGSIGDDISSEEKLKMFTKLYLIIKYKTFVKGDEKITCISAASIVAKATRDVFMIRLGKKFPKYKWNKNFGYGTSEHLSGIRKYGITKHHRKNFKPIHNILMSKTRETL